MKFLKNKKQVFAVVTSVICSVFLVAVGAYAVTTVGNDVSIGGTLNLGTVGTPLAVSTTTKAVDIYTTSAVTSGTAVRSMTINQVQSAATTGIIEAFRVDVQSVVRTGSWTNAIVGRINYTAPGKADGGMAAAICGEMSLPGAAQTGGEYYAIDAEIDAPSGFVIGGNPTNLPIAFLKFGIFGNAAAINSFESAGYLFHVDGLTAGAGDLLSANSQTLKVNIEGSDSYLVLSQAEDSLSLSGATTGVQLAGAMTTGLLVSGTSTNAISITGVASTAAINISGANVKALQANSIATASGGYGMSVVGTVTAGASDGAAAYFEGHAAGTSTGDIYGVGAWLNADASGDYGTLWGLDVGLYAGDTNYNGGYVAAASFQTHVDDTTEAPAHHYMFRFNTNETYDVPDAWFDAANVSAVAAQLGAWTTDPSTGPAAASIKVRIQNVIYYIPLYTSR